MSSIGPPTATRRAARTPGSDPSSARLPGTATMMSRILRRGLAGRCAQSLCSMSGAGWAPSGSARGMRGGGPSPGGPRARVRGLRAVRRGRGLGDATSAATPAFDTRSQLGLSKPAFLKTSVPRNRGPNPPLSHHPTKVGSGAGTGCVKSVAATKASPSPSQVVSSQMRTP
jgi:hypothetical protein